MRILVVSNLYPPYYLGGHELVCARIVDALRSRGHDVRVLTSSRGLRRPQRQRQVARLLKISFAFDGTRRNPGALLAWRLWNRFVLQAVANDVKPDVIYVFNLIGLGAFMLDWLQSQSVPVVYDIGDEWLIHAYRSDMWYGARSNLPRTNLERMAKSTVLALATPLLTPAPLDLSKAYFVSAYLRRQFVSAGFPVAHAPVIHPGLRPDDFTAHDGPNVGEGIVVSGRLTPEKGVHVFLEALHLLKMSPTFQRRRVTIIGPVIEQEYREQLQALADGLEPHITVCFIGHLPRSKALEVMREHGVFVFPALWDEPFGTVVLEALVEGLAVVATATGGAAEILTDEENCLVVPKDDAGALARALQRLMDDATLRRHISSTAPEVMRRFDFERNIDLIEEHIARALGDAG